MGDEKGHKGGSGKDGDHGSARLSDDVYPLTRGRDDFGTHGGKSHTAPKKPVEPPEPDSDPERLDRD